MLKLPALLFALLLAPLAAFVQAKHEVANATKAVKRAWESAPAEKKTLWQQQREAFKHIDLSEETQRQIVIARGSPEPGEYHAHPTTAMLADNKTMFCVWSIVHGGHAGPMARSDDAGLTWRELPPIGGRITKDDAFRCIMTFSSIVRLKDGSSLGLFHRGSGLSEEGTLQVLQSITRDSGFTWAPPIVVCDGTKLDGKHPCEPYVFRSPNGGELCCHMRENRRSGTSVVMFSRDEGKTWSKATDAPWGFTRDRHHGISLPEGRLVIVFCNASPRSQDKGGFIVWVGTYDDIKQGRPGQYRVSLRKTFKDGCYSHIHLFPDDTNRATNYANYRKDDVVCSIISVCFKTSRLDAMKSNETRP
jgi:hypothetical protein